VIGLGRFGGSLACRLEAMGHMVLGVDTDMARVQEYSDEITSAVALDATVEDALQEVDIASFGTVIVAIGEDFEATALITAYLKSLNIPRIICAGKTRRHRDILMRVGADQVIVSDEDSGIRLAEVLAAPNMLERIVLDADHSVMEFKVSQAFAGKPATSLGRYAVTALLIQRPDGLIPCPDAEVTLEDGDTVFAVGDRQHLLELASLQ
jgi:trk system potassium uptake protein